MAISQETATGYQVLTGIICSIVVIFGPYHRWREKRSKKNPSTLSRKWFQIADRFVFIFIVLLLMSILVRFVSPSQTATPPPEHNHLAAAQPDTVIPAPPPVKEAEITVANPKPYNPITTLARPHKPTNTSTLAPPPCNSLGSPTAVPFYVSVSIVGDTEINSDKIEKSIESRLPLQDFYPAKRLECASLHIDAKINVSVNADANKVLSTAEINFISNKNGTMQMSKFTCSDTLFGKNYKDYPSWSQNATLFNAIYNSIIDDRMTKFVLTNFGIKFIVSEPEERPTSQCVAD